MQERMYKTTVRDTSDLKQRVVDTWASAKHITKRHRRRCWSMQKAAIRIREEKGHNFEHLLS